MTDEEAGRVVNGLTPAIWQVGHLVVSEAGYAQRAGIPVEVPSSYEGLFKMGTGGAAKYPPLADVRQAFEATHRSLLDAAATADYDQTIEGRAYSNIGELLVSSCVHRGYHIGKLTTLRALLEKKRLFG
jgi:hypothetical protein